MSQSHQPPERSDNYDSFVPFTARMMAAMRALESTREDALFHDPFASLLAGKEAFEQVETRLTDQDKAYIAVRTRFFDDFLLSTKTAQIVLLAAGLDTRSYRLSWPEGTQVYELDLPQVLAFKHHQLEDKKPSCERHTIDADLTQPWTHTLLDQGFDPTQPSTWLIEGLLMYFTEEQVHQVLEDVSRLATPDSSLGLDLVSVKSLEYAPYKGYFQSGWDWPEALLEKHGWDAIATEPWEPEVNGDRYIWSLPPREEANLERVFLVKAKRRLNLCNR